MSGKAGVAKPRSIVDRNLPIGKISSHRRSRRVTHPTQVIVNLTEDFRPNTMLGKKIYFTYPDTEVKVPGSISSRFGKEGSRKVIAKFSRGVRTEGLNQLIYTK